jgi:hypothetical protein
MQILLVSEERGLLLLGNTDSRAAMRLHTGLGGLASGTSEQFAIHPLASTWPGEAQIEFVAVVAKRDRGVSARASGVYLWTLSQASWDNVIGLIEPFVQGDASGFQDLNPSSGPRVVLSTTMSW